MYSCNLGFPKWHISYLFLHIFFLSQELYRCGLLCYFHHRHPRLHRSGHRWWVWQIASDYITHKFHNDTQPHTQIHTCRTVVICSGLVVVWKCELLTPPVLQYRTGCTKQNLKLVEWVIIYHEQNRSARLHMRHFYTAVLATAMAEVICI